jgi:hypothetical protein
MSFCIEVVIAICDYSHVNKFHIMERPEVVTSIKNIFRDYTWLSQSLSEDSIEFALSDKLSGTKGAFFVFAGTFNHWPVDEVVDFADVIHTELKAYVMVMAEDKEGRQAFKVFDYKEK